MNELLGRPLARKCMQQEASLKSSQPDWKFYLAMIISIGGQKVLKRYGYDFSAASALAILLAAHLYYVIPPMVKTPYSKYLSYLLIALGIYYVLMRLVVYDYLTAFIERFF